jgi:DNA-binding NarL/FixJ family response regulator
MKKIRVLLADDHKIILEGLRSLLEGEFELAGAVEDGRALVSAAGKLCPDVVVADISMPLLNGIEAVRQLKKADPHIKVVFLTMHPDVTYASRAFEAGASGYVLKHSAPSELITAIREAVNGRTYVTPMIAGDLLQSYKAGAQRHQPVMRKLTARQREILQLVAEGYSAKEIAVFPRERWNSTNTESWRNSTSRPVPNWSSTPSSTASCRSKPSIMQKSEL